VPEGENEKDIKLPFCLTPESIMKRTLHEAPFHFVLPVKGKSKRHEAMIIQKAI